MKVKDMMHKGVECVSPETEISAVAKRMRELDVGAIPVATNGALVGMVTDRDITIRCVADHESISKVKAKDVMTSGVVYCRDNEDIEDAVRIMKGKQIRRLPVLDEAMQMADDRHGEPRRRLARAAARHHRRGGESRLSPPSLRANPLTPRLAPVQASIALARRARSCARDERRRLAPRRRSQACPTRPFAARPVARGYTRN